jgi:hypothetical protein
MNNEIVDRTYAFVAGDLLATFVSYALLKDIAAATMIAVFTGFFGGAAAIAGKMVVNAIIKKIKDKKG